MASLPPVGNPATDFTLPPTAGVDVALSKLRGRNVLPAFSPLAFTPVCTQDAFTEDYSRVRDADTVGLPISVDPAPMVLVDPERIVEAHRRSA